MNASNRAAINKKNAALSTGPVTLEGKQRASLNALRHALTGQTIVLPSDDMDAYRKSCSRFHTELKPLGLLEVTAVQTMADTQWRLDRIRAMENNIFSLGFHEQSPKLSTGDPTSLAALAQAKAVQQNVDVLVRLSLYEQRLNRTLTQAKAELKQLQQERRKAEEKAFQDAELIFKLKKALGQAWQPSDAGFEFSSHQLSTFARRAQLTQQALLFCANGSLPRSKALSASRLGQ